MNMKRFGMASAAVFIAFFVMEMLIHGFALSDMYQQTAGVWRSHDEMNNLMVWMFLGQIIFSIGFTLIYTRGFEPKKKRIPQGLRYGTLMAFLLAPVSGLSWYVILPIPAVLAFCWFLGSAVEMIVLGFLVGLIYKR